MIKTETSVQAILPDTKAGRHSDLHGAPYIEFEATSLSIVDRRYIPDPEALAKAMAETDDFAKAYLASGYGRRCGDRIRPLRFTYSKGAADGLKWALANVARSCDTFHHSYASATETIYVARRNGMSAAASLAVAVELTQARDEVVTLMLAVPEYGLLPGIGDPKRPTSYEGAVRAFGDAPITEAHDPLAEGTWAGASQEEALKALMAVAIEDPHMRAAMIESGSLEYGIQSQSEHGPRACMVDLRSGDARMTRAHPRLDEVASRFNYAGLLAIHKVKPPRPLWTRISSYAVEGDYVVGILLDPSGSATLHAARCARMFGAGAVARATEDVTRFLRGNAPVAL